MLQNDTKSEHTLISGDPGASPSPFSELANAIELQCRCVQEYLGASIV